MNSYEAFIKILIVHDVVKKGFLISLSNFDIQEKPNVYKHVQWAPIIDAIVRVVLMFPSGMVEIPRLQAK
jgi:hypothetical protein